MALKLTLNFWLNKIHMNRKEIKNIQKGWRIYKKIQKNIHKYAKRLETQWSELTSSTFLQYPAMEKRWKNHYLHYHHNCHHYLHDHNNHCNDHHNQHHYLHLISWVQIKHSHESNSKRTFLGQSHYANKNTEENTNTNSKGLPTNLWTSLRALVWLN